MINQVKRIYSKLFSYWRGRQLRKLKNNILAYYNTLPAESIDTEQREVLDYLIVNPISIFPYTFPKSYHSASVQVYRDDTNGLHYAMLNEKRLYYKREYSEAQIRSKHNFINVEQDHHSPHRYLTSEFNVNEGDVVIDAGAAEGNFSLSVIEKCKKAYVFETDKSWIEALNATFSPWKEKVQIVNKFVSNLSDEHHVSLDDFIPSGEQVNFMKIDVEGAEAKLLEGCKRILKEQKDLRLAFCTYHRQDDGENFSQLLNHLDFSTEFSEGFMIYYYDKLKPPYFRRGLIRAKKKISSM
jgi:Ribosomal RNA adenine dimethylase